jgi:hypothetical protein
MRDKRNEEVRAISELADHQEWDNAFIRENYPAASRWAQQIRCRNYHLRNQEVCLAKDSDQGYEIPTTNISLPAKLILTPIAEVTAATAAEKYEIRHGMQQYKT